MRLKTLWFLVLVLTLSVWLSLYEPLRLQVPRGLLHLWDLYVFWLTCGLGMILAYEFICLKAARKPNWLVSVAIFAAAVGLLYLGMFLILVNADIYYLVPLLGLSVLLTVVGPTLFGKHRPVSEK